MYAVASQTGLPFAPTSQIVLTTMAQRMDSSTQGQPLHTRPIVRGQSRGVGIAALSPKPSVVAPVTPISTPPIRVSTRRGDGLSPSPLTTEDQKRYYDTSTWRMYDRIQASRPAKQPLLPPANSLSTAITLRNAMALPCYPARHMIRGQHEENAFEGYHPNDFMLVHGDPDEELIFDLEL